MKKLLLTLLTVVCTVSAWAVDEEIASFSFTTKNQSIPTGWSGTGTGNTSTGAYYFIGSDGSLTSPSIDFTKYSKITIQIKARRYGETSNRTITAKSNNISLGTTSTTGTSVVSLTNISTTSLPSSSYPIVFTCNGTATNKGVGIGEIKIIGTKIQNEAYTVSFNAGTNGTCSTASLTEASAGAGVTLPSCTPNSGYVFSGWTATEGKKIIDTGLTAGSTYKPSANTTLYAVYAALYQVTIEEPTNGTLAVTCEGNDVTSGDYYAVGKNINIVATPADGYKFRNIQVVDGSTHTFTASNEKVWGMGESDITIKANFDEIVYRTITWSVNGNTSTIAPTQVEDGTNITFPTGLADIYGKKFMGWSTNSAANSAGDIVSGDIAASADATYYAVYATEIEGEDSEITLNLNNVHTSYTTDGVDRDMPNISDFKYYGCCQGKVSGSNDYTLLQMRKTSNNVTTSWIYNNAALNIKKVTITYTSTNNKLCNVYFGNTANPTVNAVSCDGEANAAGANTFTNSEKCKYFRIENAKNGAIYINNIVITCSGIEYNNFSTTIPSSVNINITSAGYATYVAPCNLDFSESEVVAYAVEPIIAENMVTLKSVTTVPAGKAIVVKGAAGGHEIPAVASAEDFTTALEVSATAITATAGDAYTYYYLGQEAGVVGFRPLNVDGTLAAGKCFFKTANGGSAMLRMSFGEATAIKTVNTTANNAVRYNLAGQRVNDNVKGIVIVNGKKMLNK